MPLPPALAARLAKRGLLEKKHRKAAGTLSANPPGFVEEIIAENYDDEDEEPKGPEPPPTPETQSKNQISRFHRVGHIGCPNKNNIYHACSQFCVSRWGRGKQAPDPIYNSKRLKMLKKYPLPSGWQEVYDPGCSRYYYWNSESDDVCWISPKHPKSQILRPASELRLQIIEAGDLDLLGTKQQQENKRGKDTNKKRQKREEELDPMDPAAYSDIPRGNWAAGLREHDKTGVDSSATGPLFQMRPYPSPGAVLKANAENSSKKKSK